MRNRFGAIVAAFTVAMVPALVGAQTTPVEDATTAVETMLDDVIAAAIGMLPYLGVVVGVLVVVGIGLRLSRRLRGVA